MRSAHARPYGGVFHVKLKENTMKQYIVIAVVGGIIYHSSPLGPAEAKVAHASFLLAAPSANVQIVPVEAYNG